MRPASSLVTALLVWSAVGLLAHIWPQQLSQVWWWLGGLMALVAALDALRLRFLTPAPEVTRELPSRMSQDTEHSVVLTLCHSGSSHLPVCVVDGLPAGVLHEGMPWEQTVPPGVKLRLEYRVRSLQRGFLTFAPVSLRWTSPWRLWRRYGSSGQAEQVRVYSNYEPIVRQALMALAHIEAPNGLQIRRRVGASREFHQLRDFHEGDSLSRVDWRATSRQQKLISREFREERNQTVILAVDCGRRLRALEDGIPQLDHALNAMLLLAYVALQQGDQVGTLGFGPAQPHWHAPRRGAGVITPLLEHVAGYHSSEAPTDFAAATALLLTRQKQRAMVVILTNLRSEDSSELIPAIQLLRRRHLVVIASLQDLALAQALEAKPDSWKEAISISAAHFQLNERELAHANLRAAGADVIESSAANLPVALAQHYLDIKRRGRL
jgi:uncharacterized protein (DUF58 family)